MRIKARYVIISPARDEGEYIEGTIQSVIEQTVKPVEWVIVDDGSTDDTGKIIDQYAQKYGWIKSKHRRDRGYRSAGGGVIEAFYDGYGELESRDWDFIVKLDGDLTFEKNYFEKCLWHFSENACLGIGGGDIYHNVDGKLILEKNPVFHVRGATKIYKKDCWAGIGGMIRAPGWDCLDEVKANMLGWQTRSFSDLMVIHQRFTGAADGYWRNNVKNGLADYIAGYHPVFMLAKCLKRFRNKPHLMGSLGLFWGFINGYVKNIPQVDDPALIKYLRREQLKRLLLKSSIWK